MRRNQWIGIAIAAVLAVAAWIALRQMKHAVPVSPAVHLARATASDEQRTAVEAAPLNSAPLSGTDTGTGRDVVKTVITPEPDAKRIALRIIDDQRKPVPGARVQTFEDSHAAAVETDAEGRAQLPIEPDASLTMRVAVDAPDHFHFRAFYDRRAAIDIELPRTVHMKGRVLAKSTLEPVASAHISLTHSNCKGCVPDEFVSDARGQYDIADVPVGRDTWIQVSGEGWPIQGFLVHLKAADLDHDLLLDSGVELTGVVADFVTGTPVVGAIVANDGHELVRTDSMGRFATRAAGSSGMIHLAFGAEGFCGSRRSWIAEELAAEGVLRVPLVRSAALIGTVRDEQGAPVAGLEVVVHENGVEFFRALKKHELGDLGELLDRWQIEKETQTLLFHTDDDGKFFAGGFVPYTPTLDVTAGPDDRGRVGTKAGPLGPPGSTIRLDCVMRREVNVTIVGRLLLNGAPASGYVAWHGATRHGQVDVHGDGKFVLEYVEPGPVRVRTQRGVDPSNRLLIRDDIVQLSAGEHLERDFDDVFTMKPVSGRVVRTDGGPVAGLTVMLVESPRKAQGVRQSARTSEDGRFETELPDDGSVYSATVSSNGLTGRREGIRAGDREVEIVVGQAPYVSFRALDAKTHEPIQRVDVFGRRHGEALYARISSPIGRASADGWLRVDLQAGEFDVCALAGALGFVPATRENVLVAPTGETRIELEMTRGAILELRPNDGAKPWSEERRVFLLDEDYVQAIDKLETPPKKFASLNPRLPGVDPDDDQEVNFLQHEVVVVRGLAPGRYRLFDAKRELAFTPDVIEVGAVDKASATVSWRPK
jgi:hypothetical protein